MKWVKKITAVLQSILTFPNLELLLNGCFQANLRLEHLSRQFYVRGAILISLQLAIQKPACFSFKIAAQAIYRSDLQLNL